MVIIYAHPNHEGHCGYILKTIKEKLAKKGIEPKIMDLYKDDFDPVMKLEEHYTSNHKVVSKSNLKIQEIIKNETQFIIIYPTWWNGTPAILKGFFDRVLTGKFAFKYKNRIPKGLLKGKVAVFTTTGGPAIVEKLISKSRSMKVVTKDTLNFCGLKTKGYTIYSANKLNNKRKRIIEKKVKKALKYLNI